MIPTNGYDLYDPAKGAYDAPWPARELHTSVVFKDKVWVLGGIDNNGAPLNDVWSTDEVKTWNPESKEIAYWDERYGHSSVVFDDKLWVIGGFNGASIGMNDIWSSDDGIAWTRAADVPTYVSYGAADVGDALGVRIWNGILSLQYLLKALIIGLISK